MSYLLYDDLGVIKKGKINECIDELTKITNSKKMKELYSKKEREKIIGWIQSLYHKEFDQESFFGFTIDKFRG